VDEIPDEPFQAPLQTPHLKDAYNNVNIIVTGASGFLGSSLVRQLLKLPVGQIHLPVRNNKVQKFEWSKDKRIKIHLMKSFDELPKWEGLPEECQFVFHCAGEVSDWATDDAFFDANVNSCRRVLQAIVQYKTNGSLQRVIHVSTTDVYGYPKKPCDEMSFPSDEKMGYNSSKILGEIVWFKAVEMGYPVTVVRPATIYGPGGTEFVLDVAEKLKNQSFVYIGGGNKDAGLIYVDDCVDLMIQASIRKHAEGQIYNAWGLEPITWKEYCNAMAAELHLPKPFWSLHFYVAFWLAFWLEVVYKLFGWYNVKPWMTLNYVFLYGRSQAFPAKRAVRELDFVPKVNFAEGLKRSCEWLCQEHGFVHAEKKSS
jgi:nucleoside-diphosphate-sugar epimerase